MESLVGVWFFFLVEISPNGECFFQIGENLVFISWSPIFFSKNHQLFY
jgi:hypothetical protein